jgi:hypothetical protein
MRKVFLCSFSKNSTPDRQVLLGLRNRKAFSKGKHLVYVYSLSSKETAVSYPLKSGRVLYVGECHRATEPTGNRFRQHISNDAKKGADTGANYTLTQYYHKCRVLELTVYSAKHKTERLEMERKLLKAHIEIFGTLPIAQGAGGENFTISKIVRSASMLHSRIRKRHKL